MEGSWSHVKAIADKFEESIQYIDSDVDKKYILWVSNGGFTISCVIKKVDSPDAQSDQYDFEQNYKDVTTNKALIKRSDGGYHLNSQTNMPGGYNVYPAGICDNLSTGVYGEGDPLILDSVNKTKRFHLLNNWYGIGGKGSWGSKSVNKDYLDAYLIAPATVGTQGSGYDFTKSPTGAGFNLYVPTASGAGDWNLDLSAKFAGKEYLNVTPVPVAGNNGFFDYDKDNKVMVVNSSGNGGYNLYDADIPLISFGRRMWAPDGGGITSFTVANVIGKLLYANWCIELTLHIHNEVNRSQNLPDVTVDIFAGTKGNV